jgi:hypothetical protein
VVLELFGPYHRYHGFCTQTPPVPGRPVIMHCSNEVKAQLLVVVAGYETHQTGSLGYALIYPIAIPAVCFVLGLFLMPETHKMSIWETEAQKA